MSFSCLMYHKLSGVPGRRNYSDQYSIDTSAFREHVSLLQDEGYVIEDIATFTKRIIESRSIPERYVLLTFDDGHKSGLDAAEILSVFRTKATFFLTKSYCEQLPDYLSPEEIRSLRTEGFSIGTHGVTHCGLPFLSYKEIRRELAESKHWLEEILGEEVTMISVPGGYIDDRTLALCFEHGYQIVGNSEEQMNSRSNISLPLVINRVAVRRHFSLNTIWSIVTGGTFFYFWRRVRAKSLWLPKRVLHTYKKTELVCRPKSMGEDGPHGGSTR